MDGQFFSVSLLFLALLGRTAGIRRTVDRPLLSSAVAQLRQRFVSRAFMHASKGDFGTKRPISSSFQRKQRGKHPLSLCCVSLSCVHAPVMGVCRRQSAAPRVLAPLLPLQVEVQTSLLGALCRRPPLLANALSLCPAAPPRLRSLSPIVFPQLSCPNFFSPACYSVRP